ncbi:uncharacterized protein [Chanodichthys erythropterus]|uniref:uncharacterized protein n=1 Tax=Chanodichthys erythropterus TaxID=933992 RepID=UPI00351F5452
MAEAKDMSGAKQELSLVCQSDIAYFNPGDDVVLSCHLNPAISAASMEIMWWNKEDLVCHCKDGQMIESSEDISLVVPNGTVSADPGSDVVLPVHLSPETSAVSMTVRWFRETELIYQYKNRQEKTNDNYEKQVSLSIQELERGNLSLTLRNFEPSDSGKYTCKVFHDGCLQTGIVHLQEIQKCDEANLRHLHTVLRQVRDDILQEKVQLLTRTLGLLQETLNQGGAFGRISGRSNSMEGIPPFMEDDGMDKPRTMAGETLKRVFGQNIKHITNGLRSMSVPNLAGHHHDQNPRQTGEGNTATQQELFSPNILSRNTQREITSELVLLPTTARTHAQENPGATIQMYQERRRESKSTEQRRSSLPVQESERTSQSSSLLPEDTTQTSDRPEDRTPGTQRRCHSTNTYCQVT